MGGFGKFGCTVSAVKGSEGEPSKYWDGSKEAAPPAELFEGYMEQSEQNICHLRPHKLE